MASTTRDTDSTPHTGPSADTSDSLLAAGQRFVFSHRERPIELCVVPGQYLALLYNDVVRKERRFGGREPLYVWTNVELEWEEHHYIEVRYWPSEGTIKATVNGAELADFAVEPLPVASGKQGGDP